MILVTVLVLLWMAVGGMQPEMLYLALPLLLVLWTWGYALWWQITVWRSGPVTRSSMGYGWIIAHSICFILALQPPAINLPRFGDEEWPVATSMFVWMLFSCLMLHYIHLMKPIPPRDPSASPPAPMDTTADHAPPTRGE